MGLSISASAAIIFVASVIVFGSLLGALDKAGQELIDGQRTNLDHQNGARLTHITITDVDETNGTIVVLNDGSVTLTLSDLDVLIDGVLSNDRIASETVASIAGTSIWLPQEELVIQMSGDLNGTAVMVVAGNGIATFS